MKDSLLELKLQNAEIAHKKAQEKLDKLKSCDSEKELLRFIAKELISINQKLDTI